MRPSANNITNLIGQISQLDNLIQLHQVDDDEMIVKQYHARKLDFLKELVTELINMNAGSKRIYKTVGTIIKKIETTTPKISDKEISNRFKFSISELETVVDNN